MLAREQEVHRQHMTSQQQQQQVMDNRLLETRRNQELESAGLKVQFVSRVRSHIPCFAF